MQIATSTIRAAYRQHEEVSHEGRGWDIPYHIECWQMAARAFEPGNEDEFEELYTELRNRWQALRPKASSAWNATRTLRQLRRLDQRWRTLPLHDFRDADVVGCYSAVMSMSGIKPMKSSPSIVAISKFMHFWNPRLFVIVDDGVMWRWVLDHDWLWNEINETRERLQSVLDIDDNVGGSCDVGSYIAVLRWSADLVRANPKITECFERYVRMHGKPSLPIAQYEAVAVEWLLQGLVELPPGGVM